MYTGDVWLNKQGEPGVQTFYCIVGDTLRLCHSYFVKGAKVGEEGRESDTKALRGFRVIYPELGELKVGDEWNCVYYKHNKSGRQIIEFTEDLGMRRSYLVMQTITVHSHDSIPMGGPAYATYYSEDRQEEGGS